MSDKSATFYELEHMLLDIRIQHPTSQGMVRPWLSVCFESRSGAVASWLLNVHYPTQNTLALLLYEAFSSSEERPFGGIPERVCVDTHLELALHTQQVLQQMNISVHSSSSHHYTKRGVERFFSLFRTRLATLEVGNGDANEISLSSESARLTFETLEAFCRAFLHEYHTTTLDDTGRTRLSFWQEISSMRSVDPSILALLLRQTQQRTVMKGGICYKGRRYWHPSLASLMGEKVGLYLDERDLMPRTIEVVSLNQWICTASRSY